MFLLNSFGTAKITSMPAASKQTDHNDPLRHREIEFSSNIGRVPAPDLHIAALCISLDPNADFSDLLKAELPGD